MAEDILYGDNGKKVNKMIEELEMNTNEPISNDLKLMLDQIVGES